jgi:hypothetical protein
LAGVKEMKIIALDLGSVYGYAIGDPLSDGNLIHNYCDVRKTGAFTNRSFYDFHSHIKFEAAILSKDGCGVKIVCERPSSMPRWHTLRIHMGMFGIVQGIQGEYYEQTKHTVETTPPTTIKKFWTGYGNASKDEMLFITQQLYPSVTDYNESDAIALWYHAQDQYLNGGKNE